MARKTVPTHYRTRSRRSYRPRDIIISIWDDPIQTITATVILVLFALLFVLGSICVWPYFLSKAFAEGVFDMSSPFAKMILVGGISGIVGLLISIYLCWFFEWKQEEEFSLVRIWMIIYIVEVVVNFILMPVFGVNMLAVTNPDGWTSILNLLFHSMLGIMMAFVPSFLVALLGYCANLIWYLTHRHLL